MRGLELAKRFYQLVSGQQLKFKQASAKVRAEGIKPFTKAFGKRMKQLLGGRIKSRKSTSTKKRKTIKTKTRKTKSRSSTRKTVVMKGSKRKGTSGMTRVKKVLLGLGIGAAFSTIAALTRIREVEGIAPIIDAAVGGGVEAQIGTAIPRTIRILAQRGGFGLNGGGNNMAFEGA